MDEIQTRLQETSKNCLKAYEGWREKRKDAQSQESLQTAIHELRKVASRLEIELALSERDELTARPLPIPSHRSNKEQHPVEDEEDFHQGASQVHHIRSESSGHQKRRRPMGGRSSGGHQGQGPQGQNQS